MSKTKEYVKEHNHEVVTIAVCIGAGYLIGRKKGFKLSADEKKLIENLREFDKELPKDINKLLKGGNFIKTFKPKEKYPVKYMGDAVNDYFKNMSNGINTEYTGFVIFTK